MAETVAKISDARGMRRQNILSRTVPSRKCPECGDGPLLNGRQWIVLHVPERKLDIAVCRSCFGMNWEKSSKSGCYSKIKRNRKKVDSWYAEIKTFIIDPKALISARELRGISQTKLADMLGWSRTRVRRLESTTAEISALDIEAIQKVLEL